MPATCISKASCRSAPMRPIAPAAAATGSRPNAPATRSSSSSATSHPTRRGRLIRSLLLGYYDKDELRYAGRIGTGWGQKEERDLQTTARRGGPQRTRRSTRSPRRSAGRGVQWVEPQDRGRGRLPRLDRRQAGPPGLVEGRPRGQAGKAGGARGRTDAPNRSSRPRCGRRRRPKATATPANPAKPKASRWPGSR